MRFLLVLALLLMPGAALAADKPLPPGSYQGTCTSMHFDGVLLQAKCKSIAEKWAWTKLFPANCQPKSIFNDDGNLVCFAVSVGTATGQIVWPGSYVKSCRWAQVVDKGRTLFAGCNSGGKVHPSNLDLRKCTWGKDIANIHGTLTC